MSCDQAVRVAAFVVYSEFSVAGGLLVCAVKFFFRCWVGVFCLCFGPCGCFWLCFGVCLESAECTFYVVVSDVLCCCK